MTDSQLAQTIRNYVAAGNIDAIIGLADSLKSARDRAESKVEIYLHEIKVLAQRYSAITEPATGRPVSDRPDRPSNSSPRAARQTDKPQKPDQKSAAPKNAEPTSPKKRGPQAIDIDY